MNRPSCSSRLLGILFASLLLPCASRAEEVYLFRGGFDIFSTGIDQMASQLRREGIRAKSTSFLSWAGIADDIVRRSKTNRVSYPIVVLGHSFGADAAPDFANYLGRNNIPVALVIGFDATSRKSLHAGARRVIHYRTATGAHYAAGRGFTGRLEEVGVTKYRVNHFTLEQNREIQKLALQAVRAQIRKRR